MKYVLVIKKNPHVTPDIKLVDKDSWQQVTHYLRHELDWSVVCVEVHKFSSDQKLLAQKSVTMSNMCDVCLSLTDKVLKT